MFTAPSSLSKIDNMILNLATAVEVTPQQDSQKVVTIQIQYDSWTDLKAKAQLLFENETIFLQRACDHSWMLTDADDHCLFGSDHQHQVYQQ